MSNAPAMLYLFEAEAHKSNAPIPGFLQAFRKHHDIRAVGVPYQGLLRLIIRIFALLMFSKRSGIILTTSYSLSFAVLLYQTLTFSRARHVSVSLNLSRRPLKFSNRRVNAWINAMFARLELVLVHSIHEVNLFHELHAIPRERFAFVHWGYDLPSFESTRFNDHPQPYFCMIGRNNRDRATFLEAMRDLPAHGVLIGPAYAPVDPKSVPKNVEVLYDVSNDDCLNCIANSRANVILVKDEKSGAGHITAVYAMHLSVPQVVSDALPLREYFFDGHNSLTVPIGDANAVRTAFDVLLADDALCAKIAERGRETAAQWLSTEFTEARMTRILHALMENLPYDCIDPDWQHWRAHLGVADFCGCHP